MTVFMRDSQLTRLSALVAEATGLHFPRKRWDHLQRQVAAAAGDFGFGSADAHAFVPWLLSTRLTPHQIELLASHLIISETYFWREPQAFEALRQTVLPELIRSRQNNGRTLRLWSAGCASGEEPYSLAVLLCELIPDIADWHITLLATDINAHNLQRAALGVYGEWSFRNVPPDFKETGFREMAGGQFEILPEIRNMVTFAPLNLAELDFPSVSNHTHDMDIIFCRNVLMYFVKDTALQVVQRFYSALVEGGSLLVGASELSQQIYPQFSPIAFPGTYIFRRTAEKQSAPAEPLAAPLESLPPLRAASPMNTLVVEQEPVILPALAIQVLANEGKLLEAAIACQRALAINMLDPGLHYLHAIILQEQNLEGDAQNALKRAIYLNPDFILAHFALANLARREGDARVARQSFRNTLSLLSGYQPDDILPDAEGLTAGRLREIVRTAIESEVLAP